MKSLFNKVFLILAVTLAIIFSTSKFWISKPVIAWDITLYYSYLPAMFIYDDIAFENPPEELYKRQFGLGIDEEGHRTIKMTSGMAILYSPFFLGAHSYALNSDQYEADGFSVPYRFGILLSTLVYALLGLWFFGNWLRNYLPEGISAFTVLIVFTGTNMPYYTFVEPMSHVYNFALISFILFATTRYLKNQSGTLAILIGLTAGLLVLIRPTNIIALLFPIGMLIYSRKKLERQKITRDLLLAILFGFLIIMPQLLHWKLLSGKWVVYSYGDEGFFFSDPKIWKGLFSYRKGWFVYSPVLILALPGFILLFKKYRSEAILSLILLFVAIWVTFSWWCWWYGGGFGARPLIDFLPFMGLPLGFSLMYLHQQKLWFRIPSYVVIFFLCFWSVFMNKQYKSGIIHHDSMTKELFWKQFMLDHYVQDYDQYLDPPDYGKAINNEE